MGERGNLGLERWRASSNHGIEPGSKNSNSTPGNEPKTQEANGDRCRSGGSSRLWCAWLRGSPMMVDAGPGTPKTESAYGTPKTESAQGRTEERLCSGTHRRRPLQATGFYKWALPEVTQGDRSGQTKKACVSVRRWQSRQRERER